MSQSSLFVADDPTAALGAPLGVALPGLHGISPTAQILHKNPHARAALVTAHGDRPLEPRGFEGGTPEYRDSTQSH